MSAMQVTITSIDRGSKEVPMRRSNTFSPVMAGRATVISRSNVGDSYPSSPSNRQSLRSSGHFDKSFARPGDVSDVKENREREKKDLQNLNERLASYIEKVRFLEAQNKALIVENDKLKKNALFEPSKIRQMYDVELQQARKIIDELTRQKSEMEVKVVSLEDMLRLERQEREGEYRLLDDYKNSFERMAVHCGHVEGEINGLKEKNLAINDEILALRDDVKRLQGDNNRLRTDLDNETTSHINVNSKCQSLEEELAFTTSVYEQEIRELQAMTQKDSNLEMREYWHGELTGAIREIQTEYDTRIDQIKADLETRMNLQIREIRATQVPNYDMAPVKEESKRLRERVLDLSNRINELEARNSQLEMNLRDRVMQLEDLEQEMEIERMRTSEEMRKLRGELEAVLVELQVLMDCKLTMEMEIVAYRKLLENEESRLSGRYALLSEASSATTAEAKDKLALVEQTRRTTIQRTSRGPIAFLEATLDGRYVIIENMSSGNKAKSINLNGWKLHKVLADGTHIDYVFNNITINPDQAIKILCKGAESQMAAGDLLAEFFSWGNGESTTHLHDQEGVEKATIVHNYIR